jgi:hypothetical protein
MWTLHEDPVEPDFKISFEEDRSAGLRLCGELNLPNLGLRSADWADDEMLEEPMFRKRAVPAPVRPEPTAARAKSLSRLPPRAGTTISRPTGPAARTTPAAAGTVRRTAVLANPVSRLAPRAVVATSSIGQLVPSRTTIGAAMRSAAPSESRHGHLNTLAPRRPITVTPATRPLGTAAIRTVAARPALVATQGARSSAPAATAESAPLMINAPILTFDDELPEEVELTLDL